MKKTIIHKVLERLNLKRLLENTKEADGLLFIPVRQRRHRNG